jgi:O-antigen/teichoic acid export membrane protein
MGDSDLVEEEPVPPPPPGSARTPRRGKKGRKGEADTGWLAEIRFIAIGNLVMKSRGLLLLPLIAGTMGAAAYGSWIQANSLAGVAAMLASWNMRTAAIRLLIGLDAVEAGVLLWSMVATTLLGGIVGGIVAWLVAPDIAVLLTHDAAYAPLFRTLAIVVPLTALNDVQIGALRGLGQIRTYSVVNVSSSFGDAVACIVTLLFSRNLATAMYAIAAWRVLLSAYLFQNNVKLAPLQPPTWRATKQALRYCVPLSPAALANMLLDKADRFIIGFYMGAASVGVYNAAYAFSMLIWQLVQPLRITMTPRIGAMWDRGEQTLALDTIGRVWRYFMIIAVPAAVGIAIVGEPALRLLTSPAVAATAGPLVGWISLGVLAFGATSIINQVFTIEKSTYFVPLVYGIGAGTNIALNIWLVPRMGLKAAVFSTIVSYAVAFVVSFWLSWWRLRLALPFRQVLRALFAALIMALITFAMPSKTWPQLVLTGLIGVGLYAVSLWYSGALDPQERAQVVRLVSSRLQRRAA